MATVEDRKLVDEIIAGNGHYYDDPRVVKIVQYQNTNGGICYGLIYEYDDGNKYAESPFVCNPTVIWEV